MAQKNTAVILRSHGFPAIKNRRLSARGIKLFKHITTLKDCLKQYHIACRASYYAQQRVALPYMKRCNDKA